MAKIGDMIKCKNCGKEFVKRLSGEKYCSKECYRIAQQQKVYENNYQRANKKAGALCEKDCFVCGKPFVTSRSRTICCSGACSYEMNKQKTKYRYHEKNSHMPEYKTAICKGCGRTFEKRHRAQKYCDSECYSKYWNKHQCKVTKKPEKAPGKKKTPLSLEEIQEQMKNEGYPPNAYGKFMADRYLKQIQLKN